MIPVDEVMAALEGWLFARESPTASPVFRANADVRLRQALLDLVERKAV